MSEQGKKEREEKRVSETIEAACVSSLEATLLITVYERRRQEAAEE